MMTDEMRQRQSEAACRQLMELPCWVQARTVLLYHALPDEVDTQMLIEEALRCQPAKRVLLPVVVGDDLELREYDGQMQMGAFGILEPSRQSVLFTDYNAIDLAVVPGMAFDAQGHRLGRGKGYYDKLLCQCPDVNKVGICFDYQYVEEVPSEPHDILMDGVVTTTFLT